MLVTHHRFVFIYYTPVSYKKRKRAPKRFTDGHESKSIFQPATKKTCHHDANDGPSPCPGAAAKSLFTSEDLHWSLFAQNDVRLINFKPPAVAKESGCFWCDAGTDNPNFQCPQHKHKTARVPLALRSLPPEVGLCTSSIPGAGCGICAKRKIPDGAWIGPYEGKFVKPEDLFPSTDTSYMWEIFKDRKLSGYIDGSDLNVSSWMRFIRCARHKQEQNLFAFQYLGTVFYRALKDILPGEEMLVWYDEKYPQYLGIPAAIFDMGEVITRGAGSQPGEVVVVSPRENKKEKDYQPQDTNSASSFFPSPPPSPLSSPGSPFRIAKVCDVKRSPRHPPPTENRGLEYPFWRKPVPIKTNSSLKQNNGNLAADTQITNDRTTPCVGEQSARTMNSISRGLSSKNILAQAPQPAFEYDRCTASFIDTNQSRTGR